MYKPGPFLLEPIGKEYQLLQLQQLTQLMFQHFGDKHSPVISDELQESIRVPIDQVLEKQRACSVSFQTLPLRNTSFVWYLENR